MEACTLLKAIFITSQGPKAGRSAPLLVRLNEPLETAAIQADKYPDAATLGLAPLGQDAAPVPEDSDLQSADHVNSLVPVNLEAPLPFCMCATPRSLSRWCCRSSTKP